MKSKILKLAISAALVTGASPAFADLVYQTGAQQTGTGLGAVSTVVTVQDNTVGPQPPATESGCVRHTNGGNMTNPDQTCEPSTGLLGGDNTGAVGGNGVYLLSDIDGITTAGELGFVVNISEPGSDDATLTDLYMSLYALDGTLLEIFSYTGPDLILEDTGGIGQSGLHRFVLDDLQAAAADLACPDLTQCVVAGGVQFLAGTTQGTPETVRVGAFERDDSGNPGEVPEPGSVALLGLGAMAMGAMRRRFAKK
ncbi:MULTISPECIES: PEP-CTERM sorting domain-containing protein [unclassified Massilia]|uniref:PEP-CTERM sorting domain-containing protein n=1 Tax=unclassified Massilia TaxID=2609279 RepID=UPI001B8448BE|nr:MULTISPECIES: PEP-CTERM sorting domain-containing protein [unclassified Massilia]MBQ5941181.1 PEP-CTERM sorting domain-containing protein [Massilia sp. AB1]MBQ5964704.1 PEP-CTERM sorting domain-containing protein [Massilia sp. ZL223]